MQRALQIIIDDQKNIKVKSSLEQVLKDIINGLTLAKSLEKSTHFSPFEFQNIKIGEETSKLKLVLAHLTLFFKNKIKLRRQIISLITYPLFVIFITIGVLFFMLNSVVPMFEDVFKQFGQELPALTQKIIWVSNHFHYFIVLFLVIITSISIMIISQKKQQWFRDYSSAIFLKIPIFGNLITKIYLTRLCQSMTLLLNTKTPLLNSLDLVEKMISYYPIEIAIKHIKKGIMNGENLHSNLDKHPIFPKKFISLIKIAEETNQLEKSFERISIQYQEEIEHNTKVIGTIIEPLIIVLIGLIVGVIMVSLYLPMFNLSNVIK
jgi:type IV pilus assembly protein PilC